MTEPRGSLDHASHDTFVVASLATRDPDAGDQTLADARSLVERCADCADLHADLVAIAAAAPTSAVPPRPRDFRLSDADVARLSPRGWRRFLRTIGSPADAISRPLALGFTTLGIAGLIAASIPGLAGGASMGSSPLSTVGGQVEQAPSQDAPAPSDIAAPAAAPSSEALTQSNRPDTTDGDTSNVFEGSGEGNQGDDGRSSEASEPGLLAIRDDPTGMSVLAVIAGSLLIVGLAIFLLRWSARRFGD